MEELVRSNAGRRKDSSDPGGGYLGRFARGDDERKSFGRGGFIYICLSFVGDCSLCRHGISAVEPGDGMFGGGSLQDDFGAIVSPGVYADVARGLLW